MPSPPAEGLLFVATGEAFLAEAMAAARASRPHLGGRPIALCTDDPAAASASGAFDRVLPHPEPRRSYRDKIAPLGALPFRRTLFLDTDARLLAPVDSLFALLDQHQLAAAHAPVRRPDGWWDVAAPAAFPELNSGVLLLRRGWRQRALIRRWLRLYDQIAQPWDQASLRSAVWTGLRQGLRLAVLPPEANLRTTKPWVAGKGAAVQVLHGRVPEPEWPALQAYLNGNIQRFRSSAEWLERYPDTALRPQVAPEPAG
jgi:hypothetical protein